MLFRSAAVSGYEVTFSASTLEHAKSAAESAGHGIKAATVGEAAAAADLILLAVPYSAVAALADELRPHVKGKVLIDPTNPLNMDFSGLTLGFTTSAAEEIAHLLPDAHVVKAFNTVFASVFSGRNPQLGGQNISVIYAGDNADAKRKVGELIASLGFDAIDAGALSTARQIEPLGMLNVLLAYRQGMGTSISFKLLR